MFVYVLYSCYSAFIASIFQFYSCCVVSCRYIRLYLRWYVKRFSGWHINAMEYGQDQKCEKKNKKKWNEKHSISTFLTQKWTILFWLWREQNEIRTENNLSLVVGACAWAIYKVPRKFFMYNVLCKYLFGSKVYMMMCCYCLHSLRGLYRLCFHGCVV